MALPHGGAIFVVSERLNFMTRLRDTEEKEELMKQNWKKLSGVLLGAVLAAGLLAGCGGTADTSAAVRPQAQFPPRPAALLLLRSAVPVRKRQKSKMRPKKLFWALSGI